MKAILAMLLLTFWCCAFTGCESDMPPNPSGGEPAIERGLRGKGKLVPADHSNDPMINETSSGPAR